MHLLEPLVQELRTSSAHHSQQLVCSITVYHRHQLQRRSITPQVATELLLDWRHTQILALDGTAQHVRRDIQVAVRGATALQASMLTHRAAVGALTVRLPMRAPLEPGGCLLTFHIQVGAALAVAIITVPRAHTAVPSEDDRKQHVLISAVQSFALQLITQAKRANRRASMH